MKKLIAALLIFTLFLTGCQLPAKDAEQTAPSVQDSESAAAEETTDTNEETVPVDEPVEYEQHTMIAVSMPIITETALSDDGCIIFSHSYQSMQLVVQDPEVADSIILDFLNRMDDIHSTAEDFSDEALLQYTGGDAWVPYFYDTLYSPSRIDQGVLSLYGINSSFTGGRPVQVCTAANYNMITGEVLTLGSILSHIDSKELLVDLVIQKADLISKDAQLYDDYGSYIEERFDREESFDEDWYFTNTGLCFYFSAYEIAPYSSGIVTLEVPYAELTGIIADEFFPPEEDLLQGEIRGQLLIEADMTAYTQIAEVIMDVDGEMFLLSADGAIRDVRIETGTWNETGTIFTATCTVFATTTLTPGDGIMVQTFVPDTMPNLRLSYRSGADTVTVYLSQSGENGSALLLGA